MMKMDLITLRLFELPPSLYQDPLGIAESQ